MSYQLTLRSWPNGKETALVEWTATNIDIYSRPLHYQWDFVNPLEKGSCVNFRMFFIGKGIANVCLNAIIFILVSIMPYLGTHLYLEC